MLSFAVKHLCIPYGNKSVQNSIHLRIQHACLIILPYYLANTPPFTTTPPPPPTDLMKTTVQVLLSVKTLTVTSNLCDVYKILYYAAVYVRGHFC